jgi:hypothetical protein
VCTHTIVNARVCTLCLLLLMLFLFVQPHPIPGQAGCFASQLSCAVLGVHKFMVHFNGQEVQQVLAKIVCSKNRRLF